MRLLTENEDIDIIIDVEDIVMRIDDIFHETITNPSMLTVNHDDIFAFVIGIITISNVKMLRIRNEEKQMSQLIEEKEIAFHKKVDAGKTVRNMKGIRNKFKFYILGHILLNDDKEMSQQVIDNES